MIVENIYTKKQLEVLKVEQVQVNKQPPEYVEVYTLDDGARWNKDQLLQHHLILLAD